MTINYTTKEVKIEKFDNKTVETTIKTTEKVEIDEESMFEIRQYDSLFVVAPKGTPMPKEAWVGGPDDDELRFGEGNPDPDAFDYYWAQSWGAKQQAVEEAYYWWRRYK